MPGLNIELVKRVMNAFGVPPEEAINMSRMPEIEGMLAEQFEMGQNEDAMRYAREARMQQGPPLGSLPGDIPIGTPMPGQTRAPGPVGTPGLLGPQGDFQPGGALQQREQLPQTPPKSVAQLCAESGGTLAGGICHYSTPL